MNKPISVIIVSYNSADVIAGAISSVIGAPEVAEIYVVDNASADESVQIMENKFPQINLVKNNKNKGFGAGNNAVLEVVKTPYALLLNPDARVENGVLEKLIQAAKKYPNAAILAPRLHDNKGRFYKSFKRNVFYREKHRGKYNEPCGDISAEFLSGAVWLINMQHMQKIGFFDEDFFLFYEDDDLCLRSRENGFDNVLVYDAIASHIQGGSSESSKKSINFKRKEILKSRIIFEQKHGAKYGRSEFVAKFLPIRLYIKYYFKKFRNFIRGRV